MSQTKRMNPSHLAAWLSVTMEMTVDPLQDSALRGHFLRSSQKLLPRPTKPKAQLQDRPNKAEPFSHSDNISGMVCLKKGKAAVKLQLQAEIGGIV